MGRLTLCNESYRAVQIHLVLGFPTVSSDITEIERFQPSMRCLNA